MNMDAFTRVSGNAVTTALTSVSYLTTLYLEIYTKVHSQNMLLARWRLTEEKINK